MGDDHFIVHQIIESHFIYVFVYDVDRHPTINKAIEQI